MKKFDLEEAKKMTPEQINAVICEGLAEVADMIALQSPHHSAAKFREQAETFRALGKLFAAKKELQPDG